MRSFHLTNNILISTDPNINGGISKVNSILKNNFNISNYLIISNKKPDINIRSSTWLRCYGKSPILIFNFYWLIRFILKIKKNSNIVLSDPQYSTISLIIFILSLFKKHKIFFLTHGFLFHNKEFLVIKKIYFLFITKFLLRFFSVISVSKTDSKTLKKNNFHNFIEIPNGVNMIPPTKKKKYKFCLVGRNVVSKNIDKYLDFLNFYYNQYDSSKLKKSVLISDNTKGLNIKRRSKLNIYSKLNNKNYEKIISNTEYILSFSDYEGFGLAIIEGISAGAIPICKFNDSFNEILSECRELLFFEINNDKILKQIKSIETLDRHKYKVLKNKLNLIAKSYSVKNMVTKFKKKVFINYK